MAVLTSALVTPTQIYSHPLSSSVALSSPPHRNEQVESPHPSPNQSLLDIGTSNTMDVQQFVEDHHMKLADINLVRRHSLSMRSPPLGSLAADILNTPAPANTHLERVRSQVEDIKEMTGRLSEFGSCQSSSSEDESEAVKDTDEEGFKTMNDRRRAWRKKRKNSTTPNKESFVKKQVKNWDHHSA